MAPGVHRLLRRYGTIHPLTTPIEILRYPHLTFTEKARLGLLTLRSRGSTSPRSITSPQKTSSWIPLGPGIYSSFFEPLLKSKFGDRRERGISRLAHIQDRDQV